MSSRLLKIQKFDLKKTAIFVSALMLCPVLGYLDIRTGHEMSFSIFYLIPILAVTAATGRRNGLAISVLYTIPAYIAGQYENDTDIAPLVNLWNTFMLFVFFVAITVYMSGMRLALEREKKLARRDPLTGASNQYAFYEHGESEIERARRSGHPLTIAFMDLDNFKRVNDFLGHLSGDRLLKSVVETVKSNIRAVDVLARLGGDEFALLLPETDVDAAKAVVERIRFALMNKMMENRWPVTFSIGVATFTAPPDSVEMLVKKSDKLMYEVKSSGKNNIKYEVVGDGASLPAHSENGAKKAVAGEKDRTTVVQLPPVGQRFTRKPRP